MISSERCDDLYRKVILTAQEIDNHMVTDEVGDSYPADTPEAAAAVEAGAEAFTQWERECYE